MSLKQNFNMKNTEITFYCLKQFGYLSLRIKVNGDSVEVLNYFVFFHVLEW